MKRMVLAVCLGGLALPALGFVPFFYGARSLALGQGGLALHSDANAVFLNPALISSFGISSSGLEYQHGYFDYKDFRQSLSSLLAYDLKRFDSLPAAEKERAWKGLHDLFATRSGISGFQLKGSGYAGSGYGLCVSMVDEAVVNPQSSETLGLPAALATQEDLAGLQFDFIGWHYTQYSFAYALPLKQKIHIGATLHYLKGQVTDFSLGLLDPLFAPETGSRDYLARAWDGGETDFSRLTLDLAASLIFTRNFYGGVRVQNVFRPTIQTPRRELELRRRIVAGIAFASQDHWVVALDLDVQESDLTYSGRKSRPISLGIEKGLFKNLLVVRAGMWNDLTEEDFFGSRANVVYGLGLGFNPPRMQVDLALALSPAGKIKGLAISGFYVVKGEN